MSSYIEYEEYKKKLTQQQPPSSPRPNLFQQNRVLSDQVLALTSSLQELKQANEYLQEQLSTSQSICYSIIDAVARVYSSDAAQQMLKIVKEAKSPAAQMGETIYEAMAAYQSYPSVSDWSHSSSRTPDRAGRFSHSKMERRNSSIKLSQNVKQNRFPSDAKEEREKSTSRSSHRGAVVATKLQCQVCTDSFGPLEFVDHATVCRSLVNNTEEYELEVSSYRKGRVLRESFDETDRSDIPLDTQDRRLQLQKQHHLSMMEHLMKIRSEIEQQIGMLQFSKQKIDRQAERRKLEKDLAKVLQVISQKSKALKPKAPAKQRKKCSMRA